MADNETPRPLDEYESRFMGTDGKVASERRRMPPWFFAILAVAGLAQFVGAVTSGSALPLVISLPVLCLVALLLSHLRVVLSRTHLHVQYGLWGPKIALTDIEKVEAGRYDAVHFGGWGIKRSLDGTWAYSTPGGNGQCLTITARDGKGRTRRWCITLEQAEDFRREIEALRSASGERSTGVRVTSDAEHAAEESPAVASTRDENRRKG